jgi:stress response protein YsnF
MAGRTGAPERAAAGAAGDEAMTRSEEEMHVRVERHASGKARLHKYVDVEDVEQTVPLRHEEVKLIREPLSPADREALRTGAQIGEADRFVTLHEESPVVETEVVAKERVRMRVEEHVEEKKVRGRVRKERIETDMQPPADPLPGDR